jgi:asparagine synthase (glutamine-hydrolysing)
MCGIFAVFNIKGDKVTVRKHVTKLIKRIIHRGPDATGISHFEPKTNVHHFLGHQRLSIVEPEHGDQPHFSEDGRYCAVINGEIYNHMQVIIIAPFSFF